MRTCFLVNSCMTSAGKKDSIKRDACGKNIKDLWNSGCVRPELRQLYCKLVGSVPTTIHAKCWEKLPDMTYWDFNMFMWHRSEKASNKFSEVVGVRLGRWTGVGCAKREVWTEAQRRYHVVLYAQRNQWDHTSLVPDVFGIVLFVESMKRAHAYSPFSARRKVVFGIPG